MVLILGNEKVSLLETCPYFLRQGFHCIYQTALPQAVYIGGGTYSWYDPFFFSGTHPHHSVGLA